MRLALIFTLLSTLLATAWEATIGDTCTLAHETDQAQVLLTFDPAQPLYSITVTRKDQPWQSAPIFGMSFADRTPSTITTPRHQLSEDRFAVSVEDRGFGNVLDGLQFNDRTVVFLGDQSVTFQLDGAAPEVLAFRECRPLPVA